MQNLKQLKIAITSWRESKPYSTCPIPESIWRDACALAHLEGAAKVARELEVSSTVLRDRMRKSDPRPIEGGSTLVEVGSIAPRRETPNDIFQKPLARVTYPSGTRIEIFECATPLAIQALGALIEGGDLR